MAPHFSIIILFSFLSLFPHCVGSSSHGELNSTITDNFPEGENIIPLDGSSISSVTTVGNEFYSGTITTGAASFVYRLENDAYIMEDAFFNLQDQSGELK